MIQIEKKIDEQIDLFKKEEGEDCYSFIRNEKNATYCKAYKEYLNTLYAEHAPFLDKHFVKEFPINFISRSWELTIINHFREVENACALKTGIKRNQSIPDFCFQSNEDKQKFFVECTVATPGNCESLKQELKKVPTLRTATVDDFRARVTSAFEEKIKKYKKGYDKVIGENPFIIAIHLDIPHQNLPSLLDEAILSCFFNRSPHPTITFKWNPSDEKDEIEIKDFYHAEEVAFPKRKESDAYIEKGYFDKEEYNFVSAVLISTCCLNFFPDAEKYPEFSINWGSEKIRNNFRLVRNPKAKHSLTKTIKYVYTQC